MKEWSESNPTEGARDAKQPLNPAALPVPAALLDENLRILSCNGEFRALVPKSLKQGAAFLSLVASPDRRRAEAALRNGDRKPSPPIRLADGEIVRLHAAQPDRMRRQILCLTGFADRAKLETLSAHAQKMQAVGQLAGGMAHDFNNLLTAILGACDMAETSGEIREIRQSAQRGAELIRQLLAFSRKQTLRPERLNLARTLKEMRDLLARLLGAHIRVQIRQDPKLWHVLADKTQLEQILLNLAVNARDALREKDPKNLSAGTLAIRASNLPKDKVRQLDYALMPPADYVLCEVSDTGPGIPPQALGHIFEPFFSTKKTGSGLGLSTVYGIVKQTGGFIFADNKDSGGAIFRIYLPRYEPRGGESAASARADRKVAAPKKPPRQGKKARILLVEDDDAVRRFAQRALEGEGHVVLGARDAEDALKKPIKTIDILVSDILMPGMDGIDLLRRLRRDKPELGAIFISGYADRAFQKVPKDGNLLMLPKPFGLAELGVAVRRILAGGESGKARGV